MKKIYIDGSAGTTGLRIRQRLGGREDLEILSLEEKKRKDPAARREIMNSADVVFLCLPDDAASEAVSFIENDYVTLIDTSTAHRIDPDWTYGFPELGESFRKKILHSRRIAVPGCHASGFIALVYPLIESGALPCSAQLSCHSLTGFSGGGKKMITQYGNTVRSPLLSAPREYGLNQNHKHLREMCAFTGLDTAPLFSPIVSDFYSGMLVTVPLFASQLQKGTTIDRIVTLYQEKYKGPVVSFSASAEEEGFLSAARLSGKDSMEISVSGNEERILLHARYDNLGKGASGAAVECLNLILGADITKGLE